MATPPKGTLVDKGEVHPKDFVLANRGCTDADLLTFHAKAGFQKCHARSPQVCVDSKVPALRFVLFALDSTLW